MDTRDGATACNTVRLGGPESLPAFFVRTKIYFSLSLLALMDAWDNLSWFFGDKRVRRVALDGESYHMISFATETTVNETRVSFKCCCVEVKYEVLWSRN